MLIGRSKEILEFEKGLANSNAGSFLFIEGPAGIGKSALLSRFQSICLAKKRPNILLDARDGLATEGQALLKTICLGGEGMDKLKALSSGDVWPIVAAAEQFSGSFNTLADALRNLISEGDQETKKYLGLGAQLLSVVTGLMFAGRKQFAKSLETDLKLHPEKSMLHWIAQEGLNGAVLLLDTYEWFTAPQAKISSSLDLEQAKIGAVVQSAQPRQESLDNFLFSMIRVLVNHGWTVVAAGRRSSYRLEGFGNTWNLQGISEDNIRSELVDPLFLTCCGQNLSDIELKRNIAKAIYEGTHKGNPLWINAYTSVLKNLINQGLPASSLLKRITSLRRGQNSASGAVDTEKFEILKFIFRGEAIEMHDAWRLTLPDFINRTRLRAILPNQDPDHIFNRIFEIGLCVGGSTIDRDSYFLHEEIRDLLSWWGNKEGLNKSEEVRSVYRALLDVLRTERPDLADISWSRDGGQIPSIYLTANSNLWGHEAVKCACLSSSRLLSCQSNVVPEDFLAALAGSVSLSPGEKWRVAAKLEDLNDFQITELMKTWADEQAEFERLFGVSVANRLIRDVNAGLIQGIGTVDWWLKCIRLEDGSAAAYSGYLESQSSLDLKAAGIDLPTLLSYKSAIRSRLVYTSSLQEQKFAFKAIKLLAQHVASAGSHLKAIEIFEEAELDIRALNNNICHQALVDLLLSKASLHRAYGDINSQRTTLDSVLKFAGDSFDTEQSIVLADALLDVGISYRLMGLPDNAIAIFDKILMLFGTSKTSDLRWCSICSLRAKAQAFDYLGDTDNELLVYQQIIQDFQDSEEDRIKNSIAQSIINMAITLTNSGKMDKAKDELSKLLSGKLLISPNTRIDAANLMIRLCERQLNSLNLNEKSDRLILASIRAHLVLTLRHTDDSSAGIVAAIAIIDLLDGKLEQGQKLLYAGLIIGGEKIMNMCEKLLDTVSAHDKTEQTAVLQKVWESVQQEIGSGQDQ